MKIRTVFLLTLIVCSGFIFAQSASNQALTVEELYIQSIEMRIILNQAKHESREQKLLALRGIEEMVNDGKIAEGDRDTIVILSYLAAEGTSRVARENGRLVNNYPDIRQKAAKLLGEIGGEESTKSLIQLLKQENEPMVQAEAVYALGLIGDNTDYIASRTIVNVLSMQDPRSPSDNLGYAGLLALEKLAAANDGLNDNDVFQTIMNIAMGNYIQEVKRKANELMETLKRYE